MGIFTKIFAGISAILGVALAFFKIKSDNLEVDLDNAKIETDIANGNTKVEKSKKEDMVRNSEFRKKQEESEQEIQKETEEKKQKIIKDNNIADFKTVEEVKEEIKETGEIQFETRKV